MAILEKIIVNNFRNIESAELNFSPNMNCISGNNGEGKTNLLDAIYYLSMTKSCFSNSDRFNYRYGTDKFSITGFYTMNSGLKSIVNFTVKSDTGKKLTRDEKTLPRMADHIGEIPVVMVTPSDISLVCDSAEERRKFVNAVLSQMDKMYLAEMQQYNKLLAGRNRILKADGIDFNLLDVIDLKMSYLASHIYQVRKQFVKELNPLTKEYYGIVSKDAEDIDIVYESDLDEEKPDVMFREGRQKDMILGYTGSGIHRDDLVFSLNGHPIRKCGSQGQQKSFLIALKFSQYEVMKNSYGYAPILLLDDIFDKLDIDRMSNLLSLVAGQSFGQIFITDTDFKRLSSLVDIFAEDKSYYTAEKGNFSEPWD